MTFDVVVVGGGFTGLAAASRLARGGASVCVVESDDQVGGLAGTFEFADGVRVEKFYHHWFNNDAYVPQLASQLGHADDVVTMPSRTGMYLNGRIWALSSPKDLLAFKAIPLIDRLRLGIATLRVRRVRDWESLESLSIREWLEPLCGERAYAAVWDPLVKAKFGSYADDVTAVWMWKKLVLRGGTRGASGQEELAYFRGGFGRLADLIAGDIERHGGQILRGCSVTGATVEQGRVASLHSTQGEIAGERFVITPAPAVVADIFEGHGQDSWLESLRRVRYLGNICLVLRLDRSLSETYWLNVNDPGFPFVGVIEHTNFDNSSHYGGDHIVYLSRYIEVENPAWESSDAEYLEYALPFLKQMFPSFSRSWLKDFRTWRARYAQPVAERNYSQYLPSHESPWGNVTLANMAQIYPEDRGTNYAIREGYRAAERAVGP